MSSSLAQFPDHLLAIPAAFLDVQTFGSFAASCGAAASTCRTPDLDLSVLVQHVLSLRSSVGAVKPAQKSTGRSSPAPTLYEHMECFRVIEGAGGNRGGVSGGKRTRVEGLKLNALKRLVETWLDEDWAETDRIVQEMFENAVMVDNFNAVDFLMRVKHDPREEQRGEEKEEKDDEEDDGRFLHFTEEEEEEPPVLLDENERIERERARFCLRPADVELGLLHAAEKLNVRLVWLLVKHPSAEILLSAEALTNAMTLAVAAGSMELTGCLLAHLFLRDIPRREKNDAVARAMRKAAEFGYPRLTVDLTNMLQFRTKLWQFRLAEERAERMREQEERVRELQAELNSPYFRRRNNQRRSAEAIAREQAEIEARAVRDEREAVFGVKDFRQALEAVLNTAVMQKQIAVLEAIFLSRLADEISSDARRRLFKMAIRRNDPDAGNSYIEVAKFFVLRQVVTHGNMADLLVESIRRDATYSVMALLEVNADPAIQAFSPGLIKSSLDMCGSQDMADLLRTAFKE